MKALFLPFCRKSPPLGNEPMRLKSSKERGLSSQIFEPYSFPLDNQIHPEGIISLELIPLHQESTPLAWDFLNISHQYFGHTFEAEG